MQKYFKFAESRSYLGEHLQKEFMTSTRSRKLERGEHIIDLDTGIPVGQLLIKQEAYWHYASKMGIDVLDRLVIAFNFVALPDRHPGRTMPANKFKVALAIAGYCVDENFIRLSSQVLNLEEFLCEACKLKDLFEDPMQAANHLTRLVRVVDDKYLIKFKDIANFIGDEANTLKLKCILVEMKLLHYPMRRKDQAFVFFDDFLQFIFPHTERAALFKHLQHYSSVKSANIYT
ncbi:hypothetical protein GJ496_011822 [Pomphorhynchus laevis]|nr:hypothetical protein GJ496_002664 [Pomphorhynchus laevis]KAI0990014.1 hypothetical protein GJ496_011822 [Pomphorhynchus laevis]